MLVDRRADTRQGLAERQDVVEFGRVTGGAPVGVVTILLAPLGVERRRLDVAVLKRADPDIAIGRRDGQLTDPDNLGIVADTLTGRVVIDESLAETPAGITRPGIRDIAEPLFAGLLTVIVAVETDDVHGGRLRRKPIARR